MTQNEYLRSLESWKSELENETPEKGNQEREWQKEEIDKAEMDILSAHKLWHRIPERRKALAVPLHLID